MVVYSDLISVENGRSEQNQVAATEQNGGCLLSENKAMNEGNSGGTFAFSGTVPLPFSSSLIICSGIRFSGLDPFAGT